MDRCFDCHGDQENGNSAPAPAFWAEDDEAGAHQSHLGPSDWHPELVCEDCHIVPEEVLWDGHVDTPLPAELTWGALATTDDATPSWDGTTCADVYCHGATLEVGGASNTEPTWLVVDGTEAECGTCHGLPPEPPHPQREDCSPCHPTADADQEIIITEADRHIDGVLDLEDIECDACHGSDGESAPPLDLAGNIDTSFTGVGAHREHLGASDWHAEVTCDECHLEPMKLDDPGHVDSDPPAELTWGMLAAADMATPSWDGMSCSGVYCHGATLLPGGSNTEPTWTVVDGTEADCGTCHGLPPDPPHPAPTDCSLCHPTADSTPDIVDPDLHINGVVDLGMPDCDACHGSGGDPAPPPDVSGNAVTTAVGVGAHQEHLQASTWRAPITCDQCHIEPMDWLDPGHFDTPLPAELTWGALATADGATPVWAGMTCTGAYCHGSTLSAGGTNNTPTWTTVDGSAAACGACHDIPPPAPHPPVGMSCDGCHPFVGLNPLDPTTHINGVLDGGLCETCHGAPPATGAHTTHYGDTSSPALGSYGDLQTHNDYYPGGVPYYMFGCGHCHPLDFAFHLDGTVDTELFNAAATPGSLKALNPATATFSGGACTDVYCHSTGQENPVYVPSPPWTGGPPASRCTACHDNPPAYPSGGAGTPTANTHLVMGDDGWELGHFGGLPGAWHGSYHGGGAVDSAPITCQTCHYATLDPANAGAGGFYYLDTTGSYDLGGSLGYDCTSCHTGLPAEPETGSGEILTALHVNGSREVFFDPRTSVPALGWFPAPPNEPTYPYWVTAVPGSLPPDSVVDGTTWSLHLASATYDPATKTCSSIPCHLNQSFGTGMPAWDPLVWGVDPVGWSTCNACHQI